VEKSAPERFAKEVMKYFKAHEPKDEAKEKEESTQADPEGPPD